MNSDHLTRLWGIVGAVLFYVAANSAIVFVGGEPILDIDLVYETRAPAQIVALHLLPISIIAQCAIGLRYAASHTEKAWAERIPVIGLSDLDFSKREVRLYQLVFLFAFILLPVAVEFHFLYQLKDLWVIPRSDGSEVRIVAAFQEELGSFSFPDDSHLISNERTLEEGEYVTWFPFLSPVLVGVGGLSSLVMTLSYLRALFREGSVPQ